MVRIRLPSMTTPVPPTSIGFCLVQGRTGLGSRITLVTRTIESSGPAARPTVAAPVEGQHRPDSNSSRLIAHSWMNLASLGLSLGSERILGSHE